MFNPILSPLEIDDELEVVERKGVGHPDTICDALAQTALPSRQDSYLDFEQIDQSRPVVSLAEQCARWPRGGLLGRRTRP